MNIIKGLPIVLICNFYFTCISAQEKAHFAVTINDYALNHAQVNEIKKIYGVTPKEGNYWYDTVSGMYGYKGGPVIGVMYPGHQLGMLQIDASQGSSQVIINGRELQYKEAQTLAVLFGYPKPVKGRYWLLSNGNIGIEGSSLPLGNVYQAISLSQRNKNVSNFWQTGLYSGGNYYTDANGQPSSGYVSVPGHGPIGYGLD